MHLAAGARIGVYDVIVPIGEGGMGEVYRARDTTLDRDVALAGLPPSLKLRRTRKPRHYGFHLEL